MVEKKGEEGKIVNIKRTIHIHPELSEIIE
jgi:hypothetical protein